jgi:hypothetical protein
MRGVADQCEPGAMGPTMTDRQCMDLPRDKVIVRGAEQVSNLIGKVAELAQQLRADQCRRGEVETPLRPVGGYAEDRVPAHVPMTVALSDDLAGFAVNADLAATDQLGQRGKAPIDIIDAEFDERQTAVLRLVRRQQWSHA